MIRNTPLSPLLFGPRYPAVVARNKALSVGQIEHFDIQTVYKLLMLNWIVECRTVS